MTNVTTHSCARRPSRRRSATAWLAAACIAALAGCASDQRRGEVQPTPDEARALISRLLPPNVADRGAWATDIYAAFAAMQIEPTPDNICAVVAVTEQESSFRAAPTVPELSVIAWQEIDKQSERVGVPKFVVRTALLLSSPNGKSALQALLAAPRPGRQMRMSTHRIRRIARRMRGIRLGRSPKFSHSRTSR